MKAQRFLGWLLLLGVGALAFWLAREAEPPASHSPHGELILDDLARLRTDGCEFAFLVRAPGKVRIEVTLPAMKETTILVGPPGSATKRDAFYAPEPELQWRFEAKADGDVTRGVFERRLGQVGQYIIRVEPVPTAMEVEADPEVRARVYVAR